MLIYIPNLTVKTTCVGNSLSTINISLSTLDNTIAALSTKTASNVDFLSSTMISVSGTLNTRINFLSSSINSLSSNITTQLLAVSSELRTQALGVSSLLTDHDNYLSSNTVKDYIRQGTLYADINPVDWNFSTVGTNAKMYLTGGSVALNNPTQLYAGQTGNLIVELSSTGGYSISSYGNLWAFVNNVSAFNSFPYAKNVISFYYDGNKLLSSLITYQF